MRPMASKVMILASTSTRRNTPIQHSPMMKLAILLARVLNPQNVSTPPTRIEKRYPGGSAASGSGRSRSLPMACRVRPPTFGSMQKTPMCPPRQMVTRT